MHRARAARDQIHTRTDDSPEPFTAPDLQNIDTRTKADAHRLWAPGRAFSRCRGRAERCTGRARVAPSSLGLGGPRSVYRCAGCLPRCRVWRLAPALGKAVKPK